MPASIEFVGGESLKEEPLMGIRRKGAAAAIYMDHDHKILAAGFTKFRCSNSEQAELMAVKVAGKLGEKMAVTDLKVFSDSQNMVKAMNSKNDAVLEWTDRDSFSDVLFSVSGFQVFSLFWWKRNQVHKAHLLARWALCEAGIYQPPDFLFVNMECKNLFKF